MRKTPLLVLATALAIAIVATPAFAQLTISNPSFENVGHIDDEAKVLTGTNGALFANTPVVPQTIVVTDPTGEITYVHGTSSDNGDYRLANGTNIRRTTTSTIPNGGTVLCDYDYSIWDGWTPYTYVEGTTIGAAPRIGTTGGESTLDVLFPGRDVDGYVVVGFQGWGQAYTGGCYQTITTTKSGYIIIKARAFSIGWDYQAYDVKNRVQAGLAKGVKTDRNYVYNYPQWGFDGYGWNQAAWGDAWNNIVVAVPAAGTYTLFIENYMPALNPQGATNGIWNSCWDWVAWSDGVVNITDGPKVTGVTETTATIEWDTDIISNTQLHYDADGSEPWTGNVSDNTLVTHHSITITGLTPATTYSYQAESAAAGLTAALSGVLTFTTVPAVQPELTNPDFEATVGGNPTLAPWFRFGTFDGLHNHGDYAVPARSQSHFAGDIESSYIQGDMSGIYQRVSVTPGIYVARVWIYTENMVGSAENPVLGRASDAQCRIGVDPTGGHDPASTSIVWSPFDNSQDWQPPYAQLGYKQIAVIFEVPADSTAATIYLQVRHPWSNPWVKTAFDDVSLERGTPCSDLACLHQQPSGWMLNADNGGSGYLVTKVEDFTESTGTSRYFWVQTDDRAAAFKVRLTESTVISGVSADVTRGCRVGLVGRTNSHAITEYNWAEAELVASSVNVISTENSDARPLAVTNKSLCGGPFGVTRGATGASGLNNNALVVRTTGRVKEVDTGAQPPWFVIDDGSNLPIPGTQTGLGIKVFMYDQWAFPPPESSFVTVTGVAYLDVFDPTPEADFPNNSGDEVFIRSIRTRDADDIQTLISP